MKTVNYFGYTIDVEDYININYLAFERGKATGKYCLYGYTEKPIWDSTEKMWDGYTFYYITPVCFLNELREKGIKPSKSLVFIGDEND